MKKLVLIMNPASGTRKANPLLTEILSVFGAAGYVCTVFMTQKQGDGVDLARTWGDYADLLVCVGGDGTFNEVISGVCGAGSSVPVGYIPAGTTNDFAATLGLSGHPVEAARNIAEGKPMRFDVGRFQNRFFTYIASFGAFTRTSYATPQSVKNSLGHLAYMLGGIRELSSLRRYRVEAVLDGSRQLAGEYIFGAVSNSTSVGKVLTLDPRLVDLNDGKFEVLLVDYPRSMTELAEVILALTTQDYNSPMLHFHKASSLTVKADPGMDWTLDGEYAKGAEEVRIENLHSAVRLMLPTE